jgi:hypothetical protein
VIFTLLLGQAASFRGGDDKEEEPTRQRHVIEANLWCLRGGAGAELGIREGVALILVGAAELTWSMPLTARQVIFVLAIGRA